MRQVLRLAGEAAGQGGCSGANRVAVVGIRLPAKRVRDRADVGELGRLVDREAHGVLIDLPEQHPEVVGRGHDVGGTAGNGNGERVEVVGGDLGAESGQDARKGPGARRDLLGDAPQPVRAVVDRVHRCHDGEQYLRGADVRGGLVAADVLLAHLQREAVGRVSRGILRDADEAAGELAFKSGAHGHVAGVRSTEAHRNAEALTGADGDIGPEVARRLDQREGEQVGRDDRDASLCLGCGDRGAGVPDAAGCAGVLHEDAERGRQLVPVVQV